MKRTDFDVLVVGAGLSGICAAVLLRKRSPGRSFAVLEARERLGGTWDLFRYPGVRSDSDMFTLGFSFFPWRAPAAIADGPAILGYLQDTVDAFGVRDRIQFGVRVVSASWSSQDARWTVTVRRGEASDTEEMTCRVLWGCTGYYRYDEGYTPELPGRERFGGAIIHPQRWPEGYDYSGQRVVIIGSGATAITLVPAMAEKAAHVTMLQRSPTWILSRPREDPSAEWVKGLLPERAAHGLLRQKNLAMLTAFYLFSRTSPGLTRRLFLRHVQAEIGDHVDVGEHFTPSYDPWDQRVCVAPDSDLFEALAAQRASVVTDTIRTFTERGVLLDSGEELEADLIVTATGLRIQVMGGVAMEVDGEPVQHADKLMYRGAMLSGVPNFALSLGYTNASWTPKCELVARYVCRTLNHMEARGYTVFEARQDDPSVTDEPLVDLNSGYIRRAKHLLPRQGSKAPWRLAQNYFVDQLLLRFCRLDDGVLHFR